MYCKHRYNAKKGFKAVGNNINNTTRAATAVAVEHTNSPEERSEIYNTAYVSSSGSDMLVSANTNSSEKRSEVYNAAYVSTAVTLGNLNTNNVQAVAHGDIKMSTNPAYGNVATIKMDRNPAYSPTNI